jgi:hypothetical protein
VLAEKERTIVELRETNEVRLIADVAWPHNDKALVLAQELLCSCLRVACVAALLLAGKQRGRGTALASNLLCAAAAVAVAAAVAAADP